MGYKREANWLVGLVASLSIPEGKIHSILVTGGKLHIPLPEVLPESEEVYSAEIAKEATEQWCISFLYFLEWGRLNDGLSKKVQVRRQVTKFVVLKKNTILSIIGCSTPLMHHKSRDGQAISEVTPVYAGPTNLDQA